RGRGMGQRSRDLIEEMHRIAAAAQPITGRGVGYKLFAAGLIPSMERSEMQRVYRLLKEARERAMIPWDWIVRSTGVRRGRNIHADRTYGLGALQVRRGRRAGVVSVDNDSVGQRRSPLMSATESEEGLCCVMTTT